MAELLLEELKTGKEELYYISMADGEFRGGIFLPARGHTDAWIRFHGLNMYITGCSTQTSGPVEPEVAARIPSTYLLRVLTGDELKELDRVCE